MNRTRLKIRCVVYILTRLRSVVFTNLTFQLYLPSRG